MSSGYEIIGNGIINTGKFAWKAYKYLKNKDGIEKQKKYFRTIFEQIGLKDRVGNYPTLVKIEKSEGDNIYIFQSPVTFEKFTDMEDEIACKMNKSIEINKRSLNKFEIRSKRKLDLKVDYKKTFTENYAEIKKKELPLIVGKDLDGNVIIGDLKDMLNTIVAGTTGYGKSVFLHNLSLTLLKAKAEMLMYHFDPKGNELCDYMDQKNVVYTADKDEMLEYLKRIEILMRERNSMMVKKAKNIIQWNKKYPDKKWDWIVIVIDEIADIMLAGKGENADRANAFREKITVLAQMGRSSGIRLVLCTQKPIKDVIDTIIKANCISRICFKVVNSTESCTVLDTREAKTLKRRGQAICLIDGDYVEVQTPFVAEEEIEGLLLEKVKV